MLKNSLELSEPEVILRVERLKLAFANLEPDDSNYKDVLQKVQKFLGLTVVMSQKRDLEQWYFRARKNVSEVSKPEQFSLPPAQYTSYGRCNLAHYPVFYGAESPYIAMTEIGLKENEFGYLSLWRSGINYPNYALYGNTTDVNTERMTGHAKYRNLVLKNSLSDMSKEKRQSMVALQKGMAELFICDNWAISAALSYQSIYVDGLDGVEYPDAKTKASYNFALSPNFAKKLELSRVWKCQLSSTEKGTINFFEVGELNGEVIEWRKIDSETDLPRSIPETRWYGKDLEV